jgi:Spy/CpxP family protein refolding chaperone
MARTLEHTVMQTFIKSSLLVLALGLGSFASAQTPQAAPAPSAPAMPVHKADPAREAKRLSKELGLSPDQQSQIGPILADRQQRLAALESNTTLDPKSMHKQRRAIMLDTQQKMNAVLTPAQQQQLATLKAEHHRGKGASQPMTTPPPTV